MCAIRLPGTRVVSNGKNVAREFIFSLNDEGEFVVPHFISSPDQDNVRPSQNDQHVRGVKLFFTTVDSYDVRLTFDHRKLVVNFGRQRDVGRHRLQEADVIAKGQQVGITVGEDWARERLGIPKPEEDEAVLQPSLDAFGEGLNEEIGRNV